MCKAIEEMRNESLEEGRALGLLEGLTQGKQLGKLEGIREGIRETMLESALRMLKAGKYALEEIVSISGLSLEEVQKLKVEKAL